MWGANPSLFQTFRVLLSSRRAGPASGVARNGGLARRSIEGGSSGQWSAGSPGLEPQRPVGKRARFGSLALRALERANGRIRPTASEAYTRRGQRPDHGASGIAKKIQWKGTVTSVQPRIRLTRSFDERSHTYLGYALRLEGTVGGEAREFSVGVSKAAHAKHRFRAGQVVRGECLPVARPEPSGNP